MAGLRRALYEATACSSALHQWATRFRVLLVLFIFWALFAKLMAGVRARDTMLEWRTIAFHSLFTFCAINVFLCFFSCFFFVNLFNGTKINKLSLFSQIRILTVARLLSPSTILSLYVAFGIPFPNGSRFRQDLNQWIQALHLYANRIAATANTCGYVCVCKYSSYLSSSQKEDEKKRQRNSRENEKRKEYHCVMILIWCFLLSAKGISFYTISDHGA